MENLFIFLSCFSFVVAIFFIATQEPKQISARPQSIIQQTTPRLRFKKIIYRHLWNLSKWVTYFAVGVIGLVASIDQIGGGPPWPTHPEIRATVGDIASPLSFPFLARNPSTFFDMIDTKLDCIIDIAIYGNRSEITNVPITNIGIPFRLKTGSPMNQYCDFRRIFGITADLFYVQMRVRLRYFWRIGGFPWATEYTSEPFVWSMATHRWVEGPATGLQPRLNLQ